MLNSAMRFGQTKQQNALVTFDSPSCNWIFSWSASKIKFKVDFKRYIKHFRNKISLNSATSVLKLFVFCYMTLAEVACHNACDTQPDHC